MTRLIPVEELEARGRRRRAPRFDLIPFADIEPITDSRPLVKGMLEQGTMSVVYGDSNTGKSAIALDLAIHVALGRTWRGRKVTPGGVIYIAGEGARGIRNRIAAWQKRHGVEPGTRAPFALLPRVVNLRDPSADVPHLIDRIRDAEEELGSAVCLVIVDTLSRALAGGNENGAEDMSAYVDCIGRIQEATGAHVLSIHHTGKDQAKGARGHSSLRASIDTEMELTASEEDRTSTLTVRKQRDLEKDGVYHFVLEGVAIGIDTDGDPVTAVVAVETDEAATQSATAKRRKLNDGQRVALDRLNNLILDRGRPPPGMLHLPSSVKVVDLEDWKASLISGGVLDEGAPGFRTDWKRLKTRLVELRLISIEGGLVWRTGKA